MYTVKFGAYYQSVNPVIYMAAKVSLKSIFCPMTFYFTCDSNRGSRNAIMVFCWMPIIFKLNTIIKWAGFTGIRLQWTSKFQCIYRNYIDKQCKMIFVRFSTYNYQSKTRFVFILNILYAVSEDNLNLTYTYFYYNTEAQKIE